MKSDRYVGRMSVLRLSILTFPETTRTWTARALEHDLSTTARSVDCALDGLVKIVRAQAAYDRRHGREPLSAFAAAPLSYWDAFDDANRRNRPVEFDWHGDEGLFCIVAATATSHPAEARRARLAALSA